MKNYQFGVLAALVVAIIAYMLYKDFAKKPCGCHGHNPLILDDEEASISE